MDPSMPSGHGASMAMGANAPYVKWVKKATRTSKKRL
jgi:membrane-associated phospholipid phosphatase